MVDPTAPTDDDLPPHVKSKTEAPTSGITKSAEESAETQKAATGLTETEYDFVNLMHQHYFVHGSLPTVELAEEMYGMPAEHYGALTSSESVRAALFERGITSPVEYDEEVKWRGSVLTGEQLIVADTMLDLLDARSYKKKLQDMGVSTKKWQTWLKDPVFVKYLDENTQSVLKNGQHEAALALMDKVQQGDLKAWAIYMEYTGRFIPQANKAGATEQQQFDAKQLIRDFVDIIVDEVEDHDTAARIADRIKGLITREAIVSGLTEPALIQPEVVANRELNSTMEKTGMAI